MSKLSPILQVFYGDRTNDSIVMSESYKKLLNEVAVCEVEFIKKLKDNPELLKAYEDLQQKNEDFLFEEMGAIYSEGFSFGILLGLDVKDKSAR